jgi:hypothetical protein
LSLCVLLVLAGCNAQPSGDREATTEGVGTTTTERLVNESALPPGLSPAGVTDAHAFAAAHEDALAGRSYTYDRVTRVVLSNGTQLGRWTQHTQVGPDRLRFNHTQTGEGVSVAGREIKNSRVYTTGSVAFWKASALRDGYRRAAGRGFAEHTFSNEFLLADVLNASETSVTPVQRDGETWYRVRAENGTETYTYSLPNESVAVNATDVTTTAFVAPSGLVRNVTYEFDFTRGNVTGHRTMEIRYSAVGETVVREPAWVADARAATNATEAG